MTLLVEEIALGGPNSHNPLEARFLLIALQEYHASTAAPLLPWQVDKHSQEIVDHVSSLTGYVSLYVQTDNQNQLHVLVKSTQESREAPFRAPREVHAGRGVPHSRS